MNSGIYSLSINNKSYIGSSKNLQGRYKQHLSQLSRKAHHNRYLQHLWDKYGESKFEVLATCPPEYRFRLEQWFVDNVPNINLAQDVVLNGAGMNRKEIHQYDLDGNYIQSFKSTREVESRLGYNHANLSYSARKKNSKAFNYRWSYIKHDKLPKYKKRETPVRGLNLETEEIVEFKSIREAERQTGVSSGSITNAAKGKTMTGGEYLWEYK